MEEAGIIGNGKLRLNKFKITIYLIIKIKDTI